MPYISIVIPTFRDNKRLIKCIDCLSNQTCPNDQYEVIIVNNDANCKLDEISLPENMQIISEPSPGSYTARNAGIKLTKGDIIGFTDSDCMPEANWIENAILEFESDKKIDRIGGKIDVFQEKHGSWLSWKYESIVAFNQRVNARNGVSVTANLFVKSSVFKVTGLFNSKLLSGGDFEWNERASKHGFSINFSQNVVVKHPARLTVKQLIDKSRRVAGGKWTQLNGNRYAQMLFLISRLSPPITIAKVLYKDKNTVANILFACVMYWLLKLSMLYETILLIFDGKAKRT